MHSNGRLRTCVLSISVCDLGQQRTDLQGCQDVMLHACTVPDMVCVPCECECMCVCVCAQALSIPVGMSGGRLLVCAAQGGPLHLAKCGCDAQLDRAV